MPYFPDVPAPQIAGSLLHLHFDGEVEHCLLLLYFFIAYPDIVQGHGFVSPDVDLLPYTECVEIRGPVPRVLVGSFPGMRVDEWHHVLTISRLFELPGRPNFYLQ